MGAETPLIVSRSLKRNDVAPAVCALHCDIHEDLTETMSSGKGSNVKLALDRSLADSVELTLSINICGFGVAGF